MQRIQLIQQRLQDAFSPTHLEVIDDSEKHKGHAGSRDGAGHYTVMIASIYLKDQTRVAAHQKIYEVLNDLIPSQIHAVRIKIID